MWGLSLLTTISKSSPHVFLALAVVLSISEIAPVFRCDAYAQNRDNTVPNATISKARQPSLAWKKDSTASRMKRLGSAMNLLTLGDFPVVGDLPKGLPKNPGLQILADRLTLYLHPEILTPGANVGNVDVRAMAIRLIGSAAMKPYVNKTVKVGEVLMSSNANATGKPSIRTKQGFSKN